MHIYLSQPHLLESLFPQWSYSVTSFYKMDTKICLGVLLDALFVTLRYIFMLMLIVHCLDDYSFKIVRKVSANPPILITYIYLCQALCIYQEFNSEQKHLPSSILYFSQRQMEHHVACYLE